MASIEPAMRTRAHGAVVGTLGGGKSSFSMITVAVVRVIVSGVVVELVDASVNITPKLSSPSSRALPIIGTSMCAKVVPAGTIKTLPLTTT